MIPKRIRVKSLLIDDSAEGPTYLRMDADVPDEGLEGGLLVFYYIVFIYICIIYMYNIYIYIYNIYIYI